jgi:serine/threonine-protein kinase HipA
MNGERIATWKMPSHAPQELAYAEEWLRSPDPRPLSLSMPTGPVGTLYRGAVVERYFDNLLPDSRDIRERIRQRFAAKSSAAFDLLSEIGRDCVGAIQLLPADEAPADVRTIRGESLSSADIERLLREVSSPVAFGSQQLDDFRISLAGAQEKTALLRSGRRWLPPIGTTPTTHILKLPIGAAAHGIDLRSSVENEWLSARILHAYSIPVAPCSIQRFGEQLTLVVERFDRRPSSDRSWILRLPQEDFCQATGAGREQKYQDKGGPGIRAIMDILLGSARAEQDRLDFLSHPDAVLDAVRDRRPRQELQSIHRGGRSLPAHAALRCALRIPRARPPCEPTPAEQGEDGDGGRRQEPALRLADHPASPLGGDRTALRSRRLLATGSR